VSRTLVIALTAATLVARGATAQRMPDINAPKQAAQRAVAAENARLSAQTGQAVPTRSAPVQSAPAAAAPISGPGSRPPAALPPLTSAAAAELAKLPPVTREIFAYDAAGRRDPFYSLILTEDLRPLLSDLKLVGILYEASGRRSVAIFRDVLTNAQYRVQTGAALGRMRVAQIKQRGVIFTIDEFGLSRQDSLVMMDTTKVRIR
jgi:hypothetical protein